MRRQRDPNTAPKKPRRRAITVILLFIATPLLLIVGGCLLYWYDNRVSQLDIPTPAMPANNAYDDFVKASKLASGMQHPSPSTLAVPNQPLSAYAAAYDDAQPMLAAVRQGLDKPCLVPSNRTAWAFMGSKNASFRNMARINKDCADYEARIGHLGEAMDIRLDGMEMSVMSLHGANLIGMLVSSACEAMAGDKLETLLPQLSPQELDHTAARLDRIAAKRPPYSDIVLEDGYSSTASMIDGFREAAKQNPLKSLMDSDDNASWEERRKNLRLQFTSKDALCRQHLDYFKACAEEAKKPYTGKSNVPVPVLLSQFLDMDQMSEVISGGHRSYLYAEAAETILQVETALYRYKADRGRFPATLAELIPTYLKAVPDDPFASSPAAPLHYQVKDSGRSFLLYSIGSDLKDDGGRPKLRSSTNGGDIVAGHLWNYN
ncbi:MAG TPA: hypothetical protein VKU00_16185 [Chthonomonadaceae bacterium]|nr:hypothetical protein [Chthonomonadaceae bacterium]